MPLLSKLMSMVLAVMLLQCIASVFIELMSQRDVRDELAWQEHHTSLIAPILLKEKEEEETANKKCGTAGTLITFLDVVAHEFGLTDTALDSAALPKLFPFKTKQPS